MVKVEGGGVNGAAEHICDCGLYKIAEDASHCVVTYSYCAFWGIDTFRVDVEVEFRTELLLVNVHFGHGQNISDRRRTDRQSDGRNTEAAGGWRLLA